MTKKLTKVVLGVLIEGELSDGSERELGVGPDLGEIEDVVSERLSLGDGHRLDAESPRRVLLSVDGLEEILHVRRQSKARKNEDKETNLLSVVGVLSGDSSSSLLVEVLDSLITLVVELSKRIVRRSRREMRTKRT